MSFVDVLSMSNLEIYLRHKNYWRQLYTSKTLTSFNYEISVLM